MTNRGSKLNDSLLKARKGDRIAKNHVGKAGNLVRKPGKTSGKPEKCLKMHL